MTAPTRLACLIAFGLALAACTTKPDSEMPAATTTAAAKPAATAAAEPADRRAHASKEAPICET